MSGAHIANVKARICAGCEGYIRPEDKQCMSCGRLDFIVFDSHAEMKRFGELRLLEKAGKIMSLERQPRHDLHAKGARKIGSYIPDFSYFRLSYGGQIEGDIVVEDVKGGDAKGFVDTPLSAWKRKHFTAEYGLEVKIIAR